MRELVDPSRVSDAYEAEALVSVQLGMFIELALSTAVMSRAMLDLVDELARSGLPQAYPNLRTIAVIGPPEITGYAMRAADRIAALAERDGNVPGWIDQVGQIQPGEVLCVTDAYGETSTFLCEFTHVSGGRAHAVQATLDLTWHGSIVALTIPDQPSRARRQLERRARQDGATVQTVTSQVASRRLHAGFDALLRHGRPPGVDRQDDTCSELYAGLSLARHRVAALAPRTDQPVLRGGGVAADWSEEARQQIIDEFLASPHARELRSVFARKTPLLLISVCANQLGCDPLRLGPALLERIVVTVLPAVLLAPDRVLTELPTAIRAWTSWVTDRQNMPEQQRRKLLRDLDRLLKRLPKLWAGPGRNPLRRYVQDLADDVASDGDAVMAVVERRTFAVPEPGKRGDGVARPAGGGDLHIDDLDAADEQHRQLITIMEQSSRGVHQDRFASYVRAVEQLWTNDPPETWKTAQRLHAAGKTRIAILDQLSRT